MMLTCYQISQVEVVLTIPQGEQQKVVIPCRRCFSSMGNHIGSGHLTSELKDVVKTFDAARCNIELSMSKWMLTQVNTYPAKSLTLQLVHCDGITQPEWKLSINHQSTSGQGEPEHDARKYKAHVPHQDLNGYRVSSTES